MSICHVIGSWPRKYPVTDIQFQVFVTGYLRLLYINYWALMTSLLITDIELKDVFLISKFFVDMINYLLIGPHVVQFRK